MPGQYSADVFESLQLLRYNQKTLGRSELTTTSKSPTLLKPPGITATPEESDTFPMTPMEPKSLVDTFGVLRLGPLDTPAGSPSTAVTVPQDVDMDLGNNADQEALVLSRSLLGFVGPPLVTEGNQEPNWPPRRGSAYRNPAAMTPGSPFALLRAYRKPAAKRQREESSDSETDIPRPMKRRSTRRYALPPRVTSRSIFADSEEEVEDMLLDEPDTSDDERRSLVGLKPRRRGGV